MAEIASVSVMVPYLSVYLFNNLGIPGLLEHGGRCGWGWCSPTGFGWVFLIVFWIAVAWLIAWGLAHFTPQRGAAARQDANVRRPKVAD